MPEFYPETHEYRDGSTVIPSVTQILKTAGIINSRFYTAPARERGTNAHALCERYAQGERQDPAGDRLDSRPYVNAFACWMQRYSVKTLSVETVIDHSIEGVRYCGRYDLLAEIDRKRVLVDFKTGSPAPWHAIQMAAYALAVNPAVCLVLYLKDTGVFKERYLTTTELIDSITAWKAALKKSSVMAYKQTEQLALEALGY